MKTANAIHLTRGQAGSYLVVFGIFLILLGVIGHLTHPEQALTALVFGGGFGALWMLWGILGARGVRWSWPAALATTALLLVACAWWASLSWLAVANGQAERLFVSMIITLMFAVSASVLLLMLRARGTAGAERPAGGVR